MYESIKTSLRHMNCEMTICMNTDTRITVVLSFSPLSLSISLSLYIYIPTQLHKYIVKYPYANSLYIYIIMSYAF